MKEHTLIDKKYPQGVFSTFRTVGTGWVGNVDQRPWIKRLVSNAVTDERKRIEAVFKKKVPPHKLNLEDGIWLKRLLNEAFSHSSQP